MLTAQNHHAQKLRTGSIDTEIKGLLRCRSKQLISTNSNDVNCCIYHALPCATGIHKSSLPCPRFSSAAQCLPPHRLCVRYNPAIQRPLHIPGPPCSGTCSSLLCLRVSCRKKVISSSAIDVIALKHTINRLSAKRLFLQLAKTHTSILTIPLALH